jgi:hypothetical protein
MTLIYLHFPSVQTGCCSRLTAFSVRPVAGVSAAMAYRRRRRSRRMRYSNYD